MSQLNPWSQRKEIGFFRALWQTIVQVLLKPGEFFANLDTTLSRWEAFLFYFVFQVISLAASLVVYYVLNAIFGKAAGLQMPPWYAYPLILLILIASVFVVSAIMHLFVMLFKGQGGFKGTFNVVAYTTATTIFSIIPYIGGVISGVWGTVVGIIGFKKVHKFTTPKAIVAYLCFPVLLFVIVAASGLFLFKNYPNALIGANESAAKANLGSITKSIEFFHVETGKYPSQESDLKLTPQYNNKSMNGYQYSLNLNENGYEITAKPLLCGKTGSKNFKVVNGSEISQENCTP